MNLKDALLNDVSVQSQGVEMLDFVNSIVNMSFFELVTDIVHVHCASNAIFQLCHCLDNGCVYYHYFAN